MKKKLALTLISSLVLTNSVLAEFDVMDPVDFTGDAFFMPASVSTTSTPTAVKKNNDDETLPPLKNLRLRIQEKAKYRDAINSELAPTAKDLYDSETVGKNIDVSEYTSQEEKEIFDENFDSEVNLEAEPKNKKASKKAKKSKKTNSEEVILDCEKVDYDTDNYVIYAKGNVNIRFVKQGATVIADVVTFDRINNTVKAEGNVKIIKGGQTVVGDIFSWI